MSNGWMCFNFLTGPYRPLGLVTWPFSLPIRFFLFVGCLRAFFILYFSGPWYHFLISLPSKTSPFLFSFTICIILAEIFFINQSFKIDSIHEKFRACLIQYLWERYTNLHQISYCNLSFSPNCFIVIHPSPLRNPPICSKEYTWDLK